MSSGSSSTTPVEHGGSRPEGALGAPVAQTLGFGRKMRGACDRIRVQTGRIAIDHEALNTMNATLTSRRPPAGTPFATDDARWAAVQARDARADAHFVYAVRTTGI